MNLTLRQLRYLASVADTGSVAAAARACRIAQSSILAAIDLAEAEMKSRLFDRRPSRGVTPTPAGERFLTSVRQLLAAEAEFARSTDGMAAGMPPVLRIGCFEPFGALFMPDLLRRFTEGTETDVQLYEGEQLQLLDWLDRGTVEAIVTYDIGSGLPPDATPLARVPAHALLHRDDPLARQPEVTLADLASRPLVLLDLPQTSAYLTAIFDSAGVRPRVAFRARGYDTVRAAVAAGFGFAILNMRPLGDGSPDSALLTRRPIADAVAAPMLVLADRYGAEKPTFLRRLITFSQDHLAKQASLLNGRRNQIE